MSINKLTGDKLKQRGIKTLLQLDGPILKSDSRIIKMLKRKILKPIGYYFRKKYFDKYYR
jgi:hypothetical protein